jgi:hypothetical protein
MACLLYQEHKVSITTLVYLIFTKNAISECFKIYRFFIKEIVNIYNEEKGHNKRAEKISALFLIVRIRYW